MWRGQVLSRSVFRKPHVQKILKENKIGIYRESKTVPKSDEDYRTLALALEKELLNPTFGKMSKKNSKIASFQPANPVKSRSRSKKSRF